MNPGAILPVYCQMSDYSNAKFPAAVILDDTNTAISGSPLNLSLVLSGLYANLSKTFPSGTNWLVLQKLTYDDSGRTILSTSEGGQLEVILLSGYPTAGAVVPLYAQLATYDATKFVRAIVRDQSGSVLATINLTNLGNGLYGDNSSFVYPGSSANINVQYLVYQDSGYTTLATGDGAFDANSYFFPPPSPAVPFNSYLVGFINNPSPVTPINGLQSQLVQGSDRIIACRVVDGSSGNPFDISDATQIRFFFLNADETTLEVSMTDSGAPVAITNGGGGEFAVSLTEAQTALLKPMNPAPFSVAITINGFTTLVNFPYQLQIQEQAAIA